MILMRGNRWGPEGPPEDAYSRVTEPERFAPLHDFAAELLDRLEATYDVESEAGLGLDPYLESVGTPARPTRRLVPRSPIAAPMAVGFTAFPGLVVRFGRWQVAPFPNCGCDACDETFETESDHLERLVEGVTTGRFTETMRLPRGSGEGWLGARYEYAGGSEGGEGVISRSEANRLLAGDPPGTITWQPWPRRG
jgi:hypothetical protein